jgi:TRAP-type mannitol/chloroaromatic compound transport system permease small subunit
MKSVLGAIDLMSEWAGKLFAFVVVLAFLLVTFEVVLRYAFNAPTIWGLELTIYMMGATYIMGGAFAQLYHAHVRVDVIYIRWSTRLKAIIDLITAPFFFFGIGLLMVAGAQWTAEAIAGGMTSGTIWDVPIWPVKILIPLGSLLLLLQGFATFIRNFGIVRSGKKNYER